MRTTIIIPTFWRGPAEEAPVCTLESDFTYDHATPLDSEGTLGRALSSLSILQSDEEFIVAVVAVSTRREIKQAVELKVQSIVAQYDYDFPLLMIGPDELVLWRRRLAEAGFGRFDDFFALEGYAQVRNMCLIAAILTEADVAILFDDDQIYEDPEYLKKATEFIGAKYEGSFVGGVTGYYVQRDGGIMMPSPAFDWEEKWGGRAALNQAIAAASKPPRLKLATFARGGNMAIHRTLFEKLPFDPAVPRGCASDYLINAALFGHRFFLDNELMVRHLPPPRCAPPWHQLRKDIIRFARERGKLASQRSGDGMRRITAEDFDPYPGRFLRDDLNNIVTETSLEMATEYLAAGLEEDARESLLNMAISKAELNARGDLFGEYLQFQRKWEEFVRLLPQMHIWSPAGGSN